MAKERSYVATAEEATFVSATLVVETKDDKLLTLTVQVKVEQLELLANAKKIRISENRSYFNLIEKQ